MATFLLLQMLVKKRLSTVLNAIKRAVGKPKLARKRNYPQWEDVQLIYFIARKVKKNHIPASDTHE